MFRYCYPARIVQLVRTLSSHGRGHRFESCCAHHPISKSLPDSTGRLFCSTRKAPCPTGFCNSPSFSVRQQRRPFPAPPAAFSGPLRPNSPMSRIPGFCSSENLAGAGRKRRPGGQERAFSVGERRRTESCKSLWDKGLCAWNKKASRWSPGGFWILGGARNRIRTCDLYRVKIAF